MSAPGKSSLSGADISWDMSASASGCAVSAVAGPAGGAFSFAGLAVSAGGGDNGVTIGEEMEDSVCETSKAALHKNAEISYLG